MKKIFMAAGLLGVAALVHAQMTPLGAWHSIDDETKKPKAVIRITTNANGVLSGVVEKALDPKPNSEVNCDKCTDDRKGKPKIGMEIIRGGKKVEGKDVWEEGKILDPDNGTEYRLRLTPVDGGKKLEVRGYVGTPMLGRTQTWIRAE
jgi:uncharacterized protein (DUF2147 family)